MSEVGPKNREYLLDIQSPLPEINLSHLTVAQRRIFDNLTRVVVGATLALASATEIITEIHRIRRRPQDV